MEKLSPLSQALSDWIDTTYVTVPFVWAVVFLVLLLFVVVFILRRDLEKKV